MVMLYLRYPVEGTPWASKTAISVPADVDRIERAQSGGVVVTCKGKRHYLPEWRVDRIESDIEIEAEPSEFPCEQCDRCFESAHALSVHVGRTHQKHAATNRLELNSTATPARG